MIIGFGNNVVSSLAADITASQTTIQVMPGAGAMFANLLTSDYANSSNPLKTYAKITLTDAKETVFEVCHLTAVNNDMLTVIRGQEGTTAKGWSLNDVIANFATRGSENQFVQIEELQSGHYVAGVAGGTENNLTLELPATYFVNGGVDWTLRTPLVVIPALNNTGASTLQLTMGGRVLGIFPLYKGNKEELSANDIIKDAPVLCVLDNTKTYFSVLNPLEIYLGSRYLQKDQNLSDVPDKAQARQSLQLGNSATLNVGTTSDTVAAGDDSRITGAMQKDQNGADIPDKPLFTENIGLKETVERAKNAVQKTGDEMSGKLTLPQTSSFGVNTNNTLGGSSIAIGDNDTGLKGNGDGNLAFMANNVLAGYFNENELQHIKKMLTKNFQALVDNNWPEGAGGFSGQLSSEAPFSVPMVHRQNNDNNFFPLLKGKVSLESGYPVAASFGILTSGNTNFPQIAIHAKTDFDVNDKIWIFDVATGEFRAPGRITATEILLSGKSRVAPDGNLYGDVWGGWLNDFLNNNYNRKNTASLGDYGWVRDESTGFIMQWGTLGSSNGTYNFPREFPTSCFAVFVTNTNQQGGAVDNAFGYPVSKSQFFAATKDSSSSNHINNYPVAWFAIGR